MGVGRADFILCHGDDRRLGKAHEIWYAQGHFETMLCAVCVLPDEFFRLSRFCAIYERQTKSNMGEGAGIGQFKKNVIDEET